MPTRPAWAASPTSSPPPRSRAENTAATHEIDVVVIDKTPNQANRIAAIGEAKWQQQPCGPAQLTRLEHLRELLDAGGARLLLFSRSGFTAELTAAAQARPDLELVDVARLYTGS